jgi:dihydroorotate dehydrogenase electron transfer subunit
MKKRIEDLRVVRNIQLNHEFYVLQLHSDQRFSEIFPGQFAEVRIDRSPSTFLRRPISFYDVDYVKNDIYLLIKKVGEGTHYLGDIGEDEKLNLIYPLGNSYTLPNGNSRVLLIGGGTGVAPMLILGRYLNEKLNITPNFLLGYRTAELIIEQDKFSSLGKVFITTEDGSSGEKGYVTEHSLLHGNSAGFDMIYCCGPEIMMRAVSNYAATKKIPCEVSLENLMGCGIGACLCCIVNTSDKGNVNTCTEGPVFNTKRLRWQI